MKVKYMLTLGCLALLTGCQQADGLDNQSEELPMYVEASIEEEPMSRYVSSDDSPNNLSFAAGDKIGLFVNNRPAEVWTYQGNDSWKSGKPVYWPNKLDKCSFYAYYPYTEATSKESVKMPSLAGQMGTVEGLSDCDFLAAYTNQNYGTDGTVSFTDGASFKHVSSLVAITIKGNCDLATSIIKNISFSAEDIASGTTYSFSSKTTSVIENEELDVMLSGDLNFQMAGEDKTFYFILNAGISLSDVTFCLRYATNGVSYKAEKANLGSATLASGGRYNFNLSISDGKLSLSGGDIQNWGEGTPMEDIEINNPTVEEESGDEDA